MSDLTLAQVRPSTLPKVKLCGHFESDPVSGPAAARGTRLDLAFRAMIQGVEPEVTLSIEERKALDWAVDSARILAGGYAILSDEASLRLDIPVIDHPGTSDLLCPEAHWHGDLKSGEVRDYESQMAAYSLGWMMRYDVEEWTAYLFYCDQRYVQTYRFTRESAEAVVRDALALRLSDAPPRPNQYCGWCAVRWDCEARREELGNHLPITKDTPIWADIDSQTLARFVGFAGLVEEWADAARDVLKARCLEQGQPLPEGVSVTNRKGSEKLPGGEFLALPIKHVVPLLGDVPAEKARAAFADALVMFPDGKLITTPGSTFLKFKRPAEIAAAKIRKTKVTSDLISFD